MSMSMYKYLFSNNKPIIHGYFNSVLLHSTTMDIHKMERNDIVEIEIREIKEEKVEKEEKEEKVEKEEVEEEVKEVEVEVKEEEEEEKEEKSPEFSDIYNSNSEEFEFTVDSAKIENTIELYDVYFTNTNANTNTNYIHDNNIIVETNPMTE